MIAPPVVPGDTVGKMRDSRALSRVTFVVVLSEQERRLRIAYAIRTARERRGLTPPQLGERVGRNRGTINDWEAARSTPSLVDLGPLCVALGVTPDLFAELPPIPADPIAEYLIAAAESGVDEGLRRAHSRRRREPEPPARSPEPLPPGNGGRSE